MGENGLSSPMANMENVENNTPQIADGVQGGRRPPVHRVAALCNFIFIHS